MIENRSDKSGSEKKPPQEILSEEVKARRESHKRQADQLGREMVESIKKRPPVQ